MAPEDAGYKGSQLAAWLRFGALSRFTTIPQYIEYAIYSENMCHGSFNDRILSTHGFSVRCFVVSLVGSPRYGAVLSRVSFKRPWKPW